MTNIDYDQLRRTLLAVETTGEQWRDEFWRQAAKENEKKLPPAIATKLLKQGFNHSEMQILSQVAIHADAGVAYQGLVQTLPFSQGMLSRYVKKLVAAGLMTRFHQNNNHKAVFLSITPTGSLLSDIHHQMHVAENQHYNQILQTYSQSDLKTALTVLHSLTKND